MSVSSLTAALQFLRSVIRARLDVHLGKENTVTLSGAACHDDGSAFAAFIDRRQPTYEEFVLMLLALAPHVQPDFLDQVIAANLPDGGDFPAFGGVRGVNHRAILPTGHTAQFILAGDDLGKRLSMQRLLGAEHWFAAERILWLEPVREGEPAMSGRLVMAQDVVELLTTGAASRPRFSAEFPAEHLDTALEWDDLVLHPDTLRQLGEIGTWIAHKDTLLAGWGMGRKIKPGYRALFYGPPGTGKTMAAALLGKQHGRPVFRIDLSRVVSKYIGETEKNLSRLFDKAEHKQWILFFDEADALFGKRTDIRDAHDKYANQEVSYLLQRIEGYDGLVIMATNQRGNIDDAFIRRFQGIIHFAMPGPEQREAIWHKSFPRQIALAPGVEWREVALRHELSGASILNISYYCALEILASGVQRLTLERLEAAIRREHVKQGKVV